MMRHTEDNKELGVFTQGDQVIIACKGGHFWVLQAQMQEAPVTAANLDAESFKMDFSPLARFMSER